MLFRSRKPQNRPAARLHVLAAPLKVLAESLRKGGPGPAEGPRPAGPEPLPAPKTELLALLAVSLALAAAFHLLSLPRTAAALTVLPLLAAALLRLRPPRPEAPPAGSARKDSAAPDRPENGPDPEKASRENFRTAVPAALLILGLILLAGCGARSRAENAGGPGPPPDPARAALGLAMERVLWNRARHLNTPGYPASLPPPRSLSEKSGLDSAWSGPAGEAARALAESTGYKAVISPQAAGETVFLDPGPNLSYLDRIYSLNRSLAPKAGLYADPFNRTLSLKAPPYE